MKKRFLFNLIVSFFAGIFGVVAQFREPLINLEHFDEKRLQWGYYFGGNVLNFKYDYQELDYYKPFSQEIQAKRTWGFNVGLSGSMRLAKYFDLRLEPGLIYNNRQIYFPGFDQQSEYLRQVKSTYIYIPLLVKYSAVRWYNFKPYLTAGASMVINLSSNHDLNIDNSEKVFRTKQNVFFYELGIGFDIYTPYFRLSPSIRGLFSVNNELVPDRNPNSNWTGNLKGITTRGFVINLMLE